MFASQGGDLSANDRDALVAHDQVDDAPYAFLAVVDPGSSRVCSLTTMRMQAAVATQSRSQSLADSSQLGQQ